MESRTVQVRGTPTSPTFAPNAGRAGSPSPALPLARRKGESSEPVQNSRAWLCRFATADIDLLSDESWVTQEVDSPG